jgi:hypothetical protein
MPKIDKTELSRLLEKQPYHVVEQLESSDGLTGFRLQDESGDTAVAQLLESPVGTEGSLKVPLQTLHNAEHPFLATYIDFLQRGDSLVGWVEPDFDTVSLTTYFDELEPADTDPDSSVYLAELKRLGQQMFDVLDYLHRLDIFYGALNSDTLRVCDGQLVGFGWGIQHLSQTDDTAPEDELSRDEDYRRLGEVMANLLARGRVKPNRDAASQESSPQMLLDRNPESPALWVDLIERLQGGGQEAQERQELFNQLKATEGEWSLPIEEEDRVDVSQVIGRRRLRDELLERFRDSAREWNLSVSLLRGEEGIGKSAITNWAISWAKSKGWLVLEGEFNPDLEITFQGWNHPFRQTRQIAERLASYKEVSLTWERAELERMYGAQTQLTLAPNADSRVDALRQLFGRLSDERPILFVFEDLHWCDPDSRRLFEELFSDGTAMRGFVLATWNADSARESNSVLEQTLDALPVSIYKYTMPRLTDREASEFLDFFPDELTEQQRESVVDAARGLPFLIRECAREVTLAEAEEQKDLLDSGRDHEVTTDEAARRLVKERLDRLATKEAFLLRLIALSGVGLPEDILVSALDDEFGRPSDYRAAEELIERLRELGFVVQARNVFWDRVFLLGHQFFREGILSEIRPPRRRHLYGLLADAFQRCYPGLIELRIQYLSGADKRGKAVDWVIEVAASAESRGAFERARKLWRFLEQEAQKGTVELPTRPVAKLAELCLKAGHFETALNYYELLIKSTKDKIQLVEHHLNQFHNHIRLMQIQDGLDQLNAALQHFGENTDRKALRGRITELRDRIGAAILRWSGDRKGESAELEPDKIERVRVYVTLLVHEELFGHLVSVTPFRDRLARLAEESGNPEVLGYERLFLGMSQQPGDVVRRPRRIKKWYEDARGFFERANAPKGLTLLHQAEARRLLGEGRPDDARDRLTMAHEAVRRTPTGFVHREHNDFLEAKIDLLEGALNRAEVRAKQKLVIFRNNRLAALYAYQVLVERHLLAGELDRAEYFIDQIRALLSEAPMSLKLIWLARVMTKFNLAHGRADVVIGKLDMLEERLRNEGLFSKLEFQLPYYVSRAQALCFKIRRQQSLEIGEPNDTLRKLRSFTGRLKRFAEKLSIVRRAEVYRTLAHVELLAGNDDKAISHLDTGIGLVGSCPSPPIQSKFLRARAIAIAEEDRVVSQNWIEQANQMCESFGLFQPLVLEGWPSG